jgi:hypothetical protein
MSGVEELKVGVNQALDAAFTSFNIYGEGIKQDFQEPCFFVKILSSSQDKEIHRRYKRNLSFDIHYFSDKEDINSDCNNVADTLFEVLEYVTVGNNLYRSSNLNSEVVDGVLHFFLQFNYHVLKQIEAAVKMNKLTQEVGLKNV